jgi:hypothetical protein
MTDRHPGRPARDQWPNCKAQSCENSTKGGSFGFCRQHYMQCRNGVIDRDGKQLRELRRVSSYGPGATCTVVGCFNRPKAGGLCHGHWQRQQKGQDVSTVLALPRGQAPSMVVCCVPGCDARASSHGMCHRHAQKRSRGLIDEAGSSLRDPLPGGKKHVDGPVRAPGGYLLVVGPAGYQGRTKDGRVLEHRLVVEQQIGRLLYEWEIVHHINGVRTDNRPENLQVLDGRARRGEGHPPGHVPSMEDLQAHLDHLKFNDPDGYVRLLSQLNG